MNRLMQMIEEKRLSTSSEELDAEPAI